MSRFLELLINPLSHEEPVASRRCSQLGGFIPICDMTANELRILSVYQSSNLIAFGATNVCNGSFAAPQDSTTATVAFGGKADVRFEQRPIFDSPLTATSGHCNESVSNGRCKLFTGPLFGLPDSRVGIVSANNVEEPVSFTPLTGFLACADGSKTRIVI